MSMSISAGVEVLMSSLPDFYQAVSPYCNVLSELSTASVCRFGYSKTELPTHVQKDRIEPMLYHRRSMLTLVVTRLALPLVITTPGFTS
jgi:hypothetical protein